MSTHTAPKDTSIVDIRKGNSSAQVVPGLSAQTISWKCAGEDLIFCIPDYADVWPKNNLWGNPILFPNPGLATVGDEGCRWMDGREMLEMPFHGFGDKLPWQVTARAEDSVTCTLEACEQTREYFPFDFVAHQQISLTENSLTWTFSITNRDRRPIPYGVGWHPYIKLLRNAAGERKTWHVAYPDARRWVDVVQPLEPWAGRVISSSERAGIGTVLVYDHDLAVDMVTDDASLGSLRIETENFSEAGKPMVWVVWNLSPEEDYLCVEPWSCPPNVMNLPAYQRIVSPGDTRKHVMRLIRKR